jgi:methionine sulfoxide reductase heme-binding subunit
MSTDAATPVAKPKPKRKPERFEVRFLKATVFVNALVPLALLLWDVAHDRLGANPIEFITRTTGTLTLVFLLLTLAVTPARRFFDAPILARLRRMLGLFAFFYGSLHFLTYVWLDKFFSLKGIVEDVLGRYFISIGMIAYFAMIMLALTSTDARIKKLGGPRWRQIHQRIYWIVPLGVLHYWMLVKADIVKPLVFALLTAFLLGIRAVHYLKPKLAAPPPE